MGRNINELHPRLQEKVSELQKLCENNGLIIGIGECLRTVAEQEELYAQGRTKPGNIVTNARGTSYSSQHQWGIAFDFYRNDGTGAYNESGNFFERVGNLAKSIGLGWGGDWTSIKDRPHLYLPDWGSTATKLKQQYGTPEKFMKTWGNSGNETHAPTHTSDNRRTYLKRGDKGQNVKDMQLMLIGCGYSCGKSGADGIFGSGTEKALLKFQRDNGLKEDGLYGNASKAKLEKVYSNRTQIEKADYKVGSTYTLQTEMKVRECAGTTYRAKKHSDLTEDGRKHDADRDGCLDKGTKVTCKEVKKVGDDTWIRTPSGWIAAVYDGKVYVK